MLWQTDSKANGFLPLSLQLLSPAPVSTAWRNNREDQLLDVCTNCNQPWNTPEHWHLNTASGPQSMICTCFTFPPHPSANKATGTNTFNFVFWSYFFSRWGGCSCRGKRTLIVFRTLLWICGGINITVIFEDPYQNSSWGLLVFFSIAVAKQVAVSFPHVLDRPTHLQRQDFRVRRGKHSAWSGWHTD